MTGRKLKRQLNLAQVVMLGTVGAIGGEIFVLTGIAAGRAGPAFLLALLIGGLLSYSIALNYSELASSFPVTGGAMTYVREAWGRNLLFYLVGSLDCLSSTFYAALSAVGFAYSLNVFFPFFPIVPTAIGIIVLFVGLNVLGVRNIGNAQIILGGILILILCGYILLGLILPGGFHWSTFLLEGRFFIHENTWENFVSLLSTVALVYVAYIGFEVIADDAEEIKKPDRNLPRGILISLTLCLILYPLIALVALGTIPWTRLGSSEMALSDTAASFLPGVGAGLLGFAGLIATVTTLNSAMLSATREAFTMSRDGMWPHFLSRLGRSQTPYAAVLVIGAIICAVAAIGLVDFLSYISSSGYLFVLFWSNLAMLRLRRRFPNLRRPFKAPFFPLTVYAAMGTCLLIVAFSEPRTLLFGTGLLAALSGAYYLSPILSRMVKSHRQSIEKAKDRILVPVANPQTGARLVRLAAALAQASEDACVCVFHVVTNGVESPSATRRAFAYPRTLPEQIVREVQKRNIPLYTKVRSAASAADAILEEIESQPNIKMVLAGWPGAQVGAENPVKILLEKAQANVLVLLDRNPGKIHNILVPTGGGLHSRLALRLADEIAEQENAKMTVLRTFPERIDAGDMEDKMNALREIVVEELGLIPLRVSTRVAWAESVIQGVLDESNRQPYELLVMGASEEWGTGACLFGTVDDWIIERVEHCSVLLVRHYEPAAIHWLRRHLKRMEKVF